MPSQNERILAALIFGISFFTIFIGPIVIWLLKKDESSFVDYYGREYFNYVITYILYYFISGILVFVLIGIPLLFILGVVQLIITIYAVVKALDGQYVRLPFIFRLI